MKASHIVLIQHDFSTGGSERIAIRLANQWASMGRRVTLICGTEQGPARALVGDGVAVVPCPTETMRSPWSRLQLGWRMASMMRDLAPDIVFSPGNFHLMILAVLGRRPSARRPVFVSKLSNSIRSSGFGRLLNPIADAFIRFAVRPVDVLVAMSPALEREAHAVFGLKQIAEIAEPVLEDDDQQSHCRGQRGQAPFILCAGRLAPQKDFLTAIRAFALVAAQSNLHLLILGEGPHRTKLEREAQRLGIADRVAMPGHVRGIGDYLAQADLFLMTSQYEGYPAVLIEAMAAGLPIVTTDCSLAIREIITCPQLGQVVPSRDPAAIAAAILAQLALPMPSAASSQAIVDGHRIGASAAAYLDLFDRVAA
jgi:glycosyltransferase involved in cell wall biosynthesis